MEAARAAVQAVLDDIAHKFNSMDHSIALKLVSREYELFHQKLFENERSPTGSPWAPLRPRTIKKKGHDVILHQSGRLGAALMQTTSDSIREVTDRGLTFGEDVPY